MTAWGDDGIQFPRLICEIAATCDIDFVSLAESMDLDLADLDQLFDRAHNRWETIKEQTGGRVTQ